MKNYEKELKFVKEKLENDYGYTVGYISLFGSQNYNLQVDNENHKSDIDMKAIIIPSLDDLINGKTTSTEITINEMNIEKVDVKDVMSFVDILVKANPAYLELFVGPYYYISDYFEKEFRYMRNNIEEFAHVNRCKLIRAIHGMATQKKINMTKTSRGSKEVIEKYGYDNKELHHIKRLYIFSLLYFDRKQSHKDSVWWGDKFLYSRKMIIDLKTKFLSLEKALEISKTDLEAIKSIKDNLLLNTDESKIDYDINRVYKDLAKHITRIGVELEFPYR